MSNKITIGFVGMGYAGLPTACQLAKKYVTFGFDVNQKRVKELRAGYDSGGDISEEVLQELQKGNLTITSDAADLDKCNFFVVVVPTPIDDKNHSDMRFVVEASKTVGKHLSKGDIVVYESTVYPGATEEEAVPTLEKYSKLKFNKDFFVGYSPERVVPGSQSHTMANIVKVTSGSTPEAADIIDKVYASVLENGTWRAPSIRVAEAAKIIENCQRDVNIAFINEIAMVMNALGIDTHDVIDAAATKWNFLPFQPGLVGGHCIGVDPYYLIDKARTVHADTPLLETARTINNNMAKYVAQRVTQLMSSKNIYIVHSRILVLGFTFKEDCPDVRNTKVCDVYNELKLYTDNVTVYDPIADKELTQQMYGIDILTDATQLYDQQYDAIVCCVCHKEFKNIDIKRLRKPTSVVYDVKGKFDRTQVDARL